ncbi:MAG: LysR family transcriptional regulator [Polyangiaceae bacterium]|nr:LysR family transcriptional regulator [Polyangiaceae bacterium]
MAVTLEQARALDALARHGTFAKAAAALKKQHSAVVYALRTMEAETRLSLLDRSGYRTRLSPTGELVLARCRRLLDEERELDALCEVARSGWEPRLGVVFDGVVDAGPILRVVGELTRARATTSLHVTAEFLGGVEAAFVRGEADLMVSVLPPRALSLSSRAMAPLPARLVAQRGHPLVKRGAAVGDDDLRREVLLVVRGGDPRLRLPTAGLGVQTIVSLNDFHAKKTALVEGLGYGWMPEHLIVKELARGQLVQLAWSGGASSFTYRPRVYRHTGRALGKAGTRIMEALTRPP